MISLSHDKTESKLSTQRLFQYVGGNYILLTKEGQAVFFQVDEQNWAKISDTLKDVDFRATGTMLKKAGWRCVGPGVEYNLVLGAKKGSIRSLGDQAFDDGTEDK
ncbi:MAG: hypothetical protein KAU38_07035 [Desulfobacterales bacterium]|nr:hypothetical protein [Desulfobacterales bacterium]